MGYNVAIDGPAGAGKSTIAKLVAKEKGYIYVDTGAMYRGLAIHFLNRGIDPEDRDAVAEACRDAEVTIGYEDGVQQIYLNGENVTSMLRTEETGNMASKTSAIPEVREKLLELQRSLAREKDVIMDGRDISTNLDHSCFGNVLLYLLYSRYHEQKFGAWYEELDLSDQKKEFLKRLLGLAETFPDTESVKQEFLNCFPPCDDQSKPPSAQSNALI